MLSRKSRLKLISVLGTLVMALVVAAPALADHSSSLVTGIVCHPSTDSVTVFGRTLDDSDSASFYLSINGGSTYMYSSDYNGADPQLPPGSTFQITFVYPSGTLNIGDVM